MSKFTPTSLVAAVIAALALTQFSSAQSTWTGSTNTNNWNNTSFWNNGIVPNAVDAIAVFDATANVRWTNATNTIGTLLVSGGTATIGDPSVATQGLLLATSTGKPIISNSTLLFMYADLQGTTGFTKLGTGDLTFRFNTRDLTYTGDINLNDGTLTIQKDSSLGNTNNDIIVGGNATLSFNASTNGAITLSGGRNISISNGTTLTLNTPSTNIPITINGVISGGGTLIFTNNTATSINSATAMSFTLNGANTYTGQTTIQFGAKVALGSGASLGSGTLSISSGSGSWAGLDLGGNTQNVSTFSPASATTAARTVVIANGTLNVTAPSGAFGWNGTNGSTLDMSNLSVFTFGSGGTVRNFIIQPNTGALTNLSGVVTNSPPPQTNTVYFARSSNSVIATTNRVGGATGPSGGSDHRAQLFLGTNNTFNSSLFEIGAFNGMGTVAFMANVTNGSVKLRGTNGTDAMAQLIVGNTSSGGRRGSGTIDLGVADALVANTIIGNFQANSIANLTITSSITMAGGSFVSTNLYVGTVTNPSAIGMTLTNINIFQQNGGTSSVTLLRMGENRATSAGNTITFQSTYNLVGSGALLRAQTIDAGTNSIYGANSFRSLTMSNGATLRNLSGANLAINGFADTAAGRIGIILAGNGTVEADTGRSVTFGGNTLLTGSGSLTKTGAGTLILSSGIASANTGALNISNGVVNLAGSGVASAGAVASVAVAANATLLLSQSDQVADNAAVTLSGGTIQRGAGVSEVFGNLNLTTGSFLDYGTGATGALQFGTYASESLLTVLNFAQGNVLRFGSDVGSLLPTGGALTNSYFSFDNAFTYDSGSFTITAIPEPSTYAAAAGLLGLMLWPARRRLLKEAQAMLGRPLVRRP